MWPNPKTLHWIFCPPLLPFSVCLLFAFFSFFGGILQLVVRDGPPGRIGRRGEGKGGNLVITALSLVSD